MNTLLVILNLSGLGGLGVFVYYLFKGLRERIITLDTTVTEQKETLTAVRERADEFSKLNQGYKQALEDFHSMGERLNIRRKELISELEDANKRKDEQLIELRNLELKEIELKQKSLDAIPSIAQRLEELTTELDRKVKILTPRFDPYFRRPRNLLTIGRGQLGKTLIQSYLEDLRSDESKKPPQEDGESPKTEG